jgi:N-acetylglutamate synthase-like GNAT family acetyltransferase
VLSEQPSPTNTHQQVIAEIVGAAQQRVEAPVQLVVGPWPLSTDSAGISDDVQRALLADDWSDSGTKAKQLQKLIEVQVVTRNRRLSEEHPRASDVGISVDGTIIGRVLIDLDDDLSAAGRAPIVIVDIAVHPDKQRQGIGREVLGSIQAAAGESGRQLHLSAVFGTSALRWFLAMGFVDVGGDALYRQLVWRK